MEAVIRSYQGASGIKAPSVKLLGLYPGLGGVSS